MGRERGRSRRCSPSSTSVSLCSLAVTAMRDKNVIQLHELIYLALVQMFQPPDRSIGGDAHDDQPAVPVVRIGERRYAFRNLISKGPDVRPRHASIRAGTTPFLSIEVLTFEGAVRRSGEKVPMPVGIVVNVLRPDRHQSGTPISEGSFEEGWTVPPTFNLFARACTGPLNPTWISRKAAALARSQSTAVIGLLVGVARRWLAANGIVQVDRLGRARRVSEHCRSEYCGCRRAGRRSG